MRFRLYREYGALNSVPVFNAFEQGLKSLGHEVVDTDEDIAVIWSVLWSGRMQPNQKIYKQCQAQSKPIIIIEVGNLKRNVTWRVCADHINGLGKFGNHENLDLERPQKLGVFLKPYQEIRRPEILIACQHERSLQWQGQTPMGKWAQDMVYKIKNHSDRKIIIRPHPRSPFYVDIPGTVVEQPIKIKGTYDDFNINYNYHCVLNFNSGPALQAAINGVPIICDKSSLAGEISEKIENIENPLLPSREDWFLKLCHTEWTVEEISSGIPLDRLIKEIYS